MEQVELDTALEELELRLERLRALYEQYFMGLEKIEPQIARKDVDRRIYVLRREKIRNTAKRFKLQTIIQRYNTFQQYWQRICREIENGTYKRHLLKAQKNGDLLTIAARKRLGRQARNAGPAEEAAPSQPPGESASAPAPSVPVPSAPTPSVPVPSAPPMSRRPPVPSRPGVASVGPAPPSAAPSAPAAAAAPPPAAPKVAPQPRPAPAKFESLDLDMDFMGDWDPGAKRAGAKPPAVTPKPVAPAAAPAPAKPAAMPAPVAARPSPAAVRPASIPPAPVSMPPRPMASRPPTAPLQPAAPRDPGAARPLGSRPLGAAPPPKPLARPAAAPPPKPAPAPAPAAASASDEARMRDLHARLQQAKQQTTEANVSYEGLAKSIRATEAKLREQHKNRKIDFDVVIKDGKAVVKPIVR